MPSVAVKPRLDRVARALGVSNDFVYRDWALTYILAGIGASAALRDQLIFKGGTALRKCLVPDWRYSVDLDFSAIQPFGCREQLGHLEAAVPAMVEAAAEHGQLLTCEAAFAIIDDLLDAIFRELPPAG